MKNHNTVSRRDFLFRSAAFLSLFIGARNLFSTENKSAAVNDAVKSVTGKTVEEMKEGGITLQAPPIAESGAEVPVKVNVSIPVEKVKSIHVFVDGNPSPHIIGLAVTPMSGKAYMDAMIRFAKSSPVRAVAVLHDGSAVMATREVKVTVGGCG